VRKTIWRDSAAGWTKAPFLVDKMLGNYLSIGMIHLLFPRATILHSVRDPVDTCLVGFRQLFRTGSETTYDLHDIGTHYVRCREMMAHWATAQLGRV
jgi:sulfotransferase family protein